MARKKQPTKVESAVREATEFVMRLCEPKAMTPGEALQFLDEVIADLEGSVEALKEENPDLAE